MESFLIGKISWIQDESQIVPCFHPLLDLPESFFPQPTGPIPFYCGTELPGRYEHYPGVIQPVFSEKKLRARASYILPHRKEFRDEECPPKPLLLSKASFHRKQ